nr:hypothetical protein [Tanacetum cinerariifolium]
MLKDFPSLPSLEKQQCRTCIDIRVKRQHMELPLEGRLSLSNVLEALFLCKHVGCFLCLQGSDDYDQTEEEPEDYVEARHNV